MSAGAHILFVSNGHGEAAIAVRIAQEIHALDGQTRLEHLPLVGLGSPSPVLATVGPRAAMPSGGLVAMGNVGAFARDLRAGFATLFVAQLRFLRAARSQYCVALAVGDAYALALTLLSALPTFFVGTAKSAYVAPYGALERTILRRARRAFVRDEQTPHDLERAGLRNASAPGNVIVDLLRARCCCRRPDRGSGSCPAVELPPTATRFAWRGSCARSARMTPQLRRPCSRLRPDSTRRSSPRTLPPTVGT